jgi:DNA-binding PadR family transcriptional regulator
MTGPGRAETRMLYGRRRVPRSHRRLILAMLASDQVYAHQLMQLAQVGPERTTVWLVRMQVLGWVEMIMEPVSQDDRRIRYRLTGSGASCMRRLLGLDPDPWPRLANNPWPGDKEADR